MNKFEVKQIQCPNCKSYKTNDRKLIWIISGVFLTIISIPLLPFIIGIPFLIWGIIWLLAGFGLKKEIRIKCQHCKFEFPKP